MKKFNALYFLELRLVLFRFLILVAVMMAAYVLLFCTKGLEASEYGFDAALQCAGFDKVAMISGVAAIVLVFLTKILTLKDAKYRFKLGSTSGAQALLASFLAAFTVMLLWYAFTILAFFIAIGISVNFSKYTGGANGYVYCMISSSIARTLVPFMSPWLFLRNVALLLIPSLLASIPNIIDVVKKRG